jgi:Rad3-related DNA helicase
LKAFNSQNSILDFFPKNSQPRTQQKEALLKIEESFNKGKKFVIGCLPTGSGKSHIGYTVGLSSRLMDADLVELIKNYSIYKKNKNGDYHYEDNFLSKKPSSAFILTITKSLQEQYLGLFNDIKVLKGKNNYQCDVDGNFSAENAPCIFSKKLKSDCFDKCRCPYYEARNDSLASQSPILNYRVFFNLPDFLKRREIYICDEASGLEDELVAKYSLSLPYNFLEFEKIKFKKVLSDNERDSLFWLQDIQLQIDDIYEEIINNLNSYDISSPNDKKYLKDMQRLSKISKIKHTLSDTIDNWEKCSYLLEKKDKDGVVFCPYNIKPLAKKLFDNADKVLMMSATISNHEVYAKSLGIDDYEYFEAKSSFDPKKSPIFCSKKYKLSYKNIEKDLPPVIEAAMAICETHKNEKGVIHTHTNNITEKIKGKVKGDRRFLFKDEINNNEMLLEEHKANEEATILVSPSLDTGISLDDELGRFQIIIKSPYLPLGSKRIKKMFEKNPKHYTMKMLDKLIQMSGRCTRSKNDYSVTYILDGVAVDVIMREKTNLPKHFLERFV